SYSYVFQGQTGSLDHAFVTSSSLSQLTGSSVWNINADEPIGKDYNQEFNPAYLYSADPYRSSDHDPVLVGFNLQGAQNTPPAVSITSPSTGASYSAGSNITLQATATDADGSIVKVEFYAGSLKLGADSTAPYEYTARNVEAGTYTITALATDNDSALAVSDSIVITVAACQGSGTISAEGYNGIPGTQVANLLGSPAYPDSPSVSVSLGQFEFGSNIGDNYGARVRGYICAPSTGYYTFYIAGDHQCGLWLSTDENPANKSLIAYSELPVPLRAYYNRSTQRSALVHLFKGARYYIEALHKEATGNDHLSVAWQLPDGNIEAPIPGRRLSPWQSSSSARVAGNFNQAMEKAGRLQSSNLNVTFSPNPSNTYFNLSAKSAVLKPLAVTVTDASGKVIERVQNLTSGAALQLGSNYAPGVYFVEVRQGAQTVRTKLIKQ
ncbi:MAG: T9SS type A sorting domain-containing protein, partial [Chitinophagaceae bacterium]|nr:T9SS type A sorting domain-containing protein [Chitinophagaceae bacterium]